jgi:hypothetical protein
MKSPDQDDAKLAAKIGDAIKAHDAAAAVKEEKAKIVGKLLVEARKRHRTTKAFETFLETVPRHDGGDGINIRRAETFIAIALGRKDFEQHQKENAAAQQRRRDKLKAERIEREKKAKAALAEAQAEAQATPVPEPSALRNAQTSLRLFELACRNFLPELNEADQKKARAFVVSDKWRPEQKKEAA